MSLEFHWRVAFLFPPRRHRPPRVGRLFTWFYRVFFFLPGFRMRGRSLTRLGILGDAAEVGAQIRDAVYANGPHLICMLCCFFFECFDVFTTTVRIALNNAMTRP